VSDVGRQKKLLQTTEISFLPWTEYKTLRHYVIYRVLLVETANAEQILFRSSGMRFENSLFVGFPLILMLEYFHVSHILRCYRLWHMKLFINGICMTFWT
jgi:hypothetical protein